MTQSRLCLLVICAAALPGCGASTMPGCADSSVSALALETAKVQVRDLVLYDALKRRVSLEVALTHPKYEQFKARTDASYINEVVGDVDQYVSSKVFSIEAIRVDVIRAQSPAKDSGSVSCAADFVMQGIDGTKKFPITYTVKPADDGRKIQVEVAGL